MAKKKNNFIDAGNYKTYDDSKGFGSPEEWVDDFRHRLGLDKARNVLGDDNPFDVLGIDRGANWFIVKQSHRRQALEWHPDKHRQKSKTEQGFANQKFLRIQAAYEMIEDKAK